LQYPLLPTGKKIVLAIDDELKNIQYPRLRAMPKNFTNAKYAALHSKESRKPRS